jgi:hypothetical protein
MFNAETYQESEKERLSFAGSTGCACKKGPAGPTRVPFSP